MKCSMSEILHTTHTIIGEEKGIVRYNGRCMPLVGGGSMSILLDKECLLDTSTCFKLLKRDNFKKGIFTFKTASLI